MDIKKSLLADADDGLKNLLADAEARLEREAQGLQRKREIIAALPDALPFPPRLITASGYKCQGMLGFKLTRAEALALIDVLAPVPATLLKGGCTTFIPDQAFDGVLQPGQTATPVSPWHYHVRPLQNYAPQAEIDWWTELRPDLIVKVSVDVKDDPVRVWSAHERDMSGRVVKLRWRFEDIPQGKVIAWYASTDEDAGALTVYWDDPATESFVLLSRGTHTRIR